MNLVYERDFIDGGVFANIFPGMKFYRAPELPMKTYETDKGIFKVTDLRVLNEDAARVILEMISFCCLNDDVNEFNIRILPDADPGKIELIVDIVHAFKWSGKKKGRNGFELSSGLVIGDEREGDIISFQIVKEHAKAMRDYYLSLDDKESIPLFGLVIACVQNSIKGFQEVKP